MAKNGIWLKKIREIDLFDYTSFFGLDVFKYSLLVWIWRINFHLFFNQAEGVLHDTETKLDEYKDQVPAEDVTKMKDQIKEVREKLANKEAMSGEEIKKTVSDLQSSSLKMFEVAYKKMASEREAGSGSSNNSTSNEDTKKEEGEGKA